MNSRRAVSGYFVILALILLICFSGSYSADASTGSAQSPLGYEMKSIERSYSNAQSYEEFKSYCRCRYPVFWGGNSATLVNRAVNSYIADSTGIRLGEEHGGSNSIDVLADEFLKQYERFRKEHKSRIPYQFDLKGGVLLNRSGLLTLDITFSSYSGGAHGMKRIAYFVFDTVSGKRLRLEDIFLPGFERRLNELIDARFRQMKGLSKSERLDGDGGRLFGNALHYNQNFALTDKGVTFVYNVYEIAPYVYGATVIQLSYRDLSAILKPRFKAF